MLHGCNEVIVEYNAESVLLLRRFKLPTMLNRCKCSNDVMQQCYLSFNWLRDRPIHDAIVFTNKPRNRLKNMFQVTCSLAGSVYSPLLTLYLELKFKYAMRVGECWSEIYALHLRQSSFLFTLSYDVWSFHLFEGWILNMDKKLPLFVHYAWT
jgi:hypothetical protein